MAQTLDHSSHPACRRIACPRFRLCGCKGPTPFPRNIIQAKSKSATSIRDILILSSNLRLDLSSDLSLKNVGLNCALIYDPMRAIRSAYSLRLFNL